MKKIFLFFTLFLLIGCGKSDKELMDEGKANVEQGNIPEAVISFEEIVNEKPNSELAPEAISQLATIYQNKLVKNISEQESLEKAAGLYKKIFDNYPESSLAPMGLFMTGFIQANELMNYDRATETYKLFIEKYPDHELAGSAREELTNMGLTPEEILQKNLAREE